VAKTNDWNSLGAAMILFAAMFIVGSAANIASFFLTASPRLFTRKMEILLFLVPTVYFLVSVIVFVFQR
jgi:hypothetical protein